MGLYRIIVIILVAIQVQIWVLVSGTPTQGQTVTRNQNKCAEKASLGVCYRDVIQLFCCNGTQISRKKRSISADIKKYYLPCKDEVSSDPEQTTETADFLWKVEACVFRKKHDNNEITYEKYVEGETESFSTENDVKSTIINSNKECPEATGEPEFYKQYKAMHNCFITSLEQECTSEKVLKKATKSWTNLKKKMSSNCPHIPGIKNQFHHCCKSDSLPHSIDTPLNIQLAVAPNSKETKKCMKSIDAIAKKDEIHLHGGCRDACRLNPVVFKKDSEAPTIDWKSKASFSYIFAFLDISAVQKELLETAEKMFSTAKVADSKEQKVAKTGYSFAEMESAFATKPMNESISLYCLYYVGINVLAKAALFEHCHGSTQAEKFLQQRGIF